jgi:hypothetical protein
MDDFVKATAEQEFSLMLHDRLVELEKKVADLEPALLDPRIRIAERPRHPFVKVEFDDEIDHSTWLKSVVERLGRRFDTKVSGVACQGWSLRAEKYVVEAVFEGGGAMDHREVGRACLETGTIFGKVGAVHVHEVTNVAWFMESIASAEAEHATYEDGVVATRTDGPVDDATRSSWYRLNGWLASVTEDADVEHLRAFDAHSAAISLYRASARPL